MAASIISVLTATGAVLSTPLMLPTTTTPTSIGDISPTTTTQALSAVTSGLSLHTPTIHFITVGAAEELAFEPPFVDVTVGDVVSFTFHALNHSLVEVQSERSLQCTTRRLQHRFPSVQRRGRLDHGSVLYSQLASPAILFLRSERACATL